MSLTKSLARVDNTLTDNFKNKNFVNGFRIACGICFFLLLQAKPCDLQFVNNLFFRLAYLCLVAYVMMIDTMSSVVLASIFVVAVYVANNKNTLAMDLTGNDLIIPSNTSNTSNTHTPFMEKILEPNFDNDSHPAYQTLTENIETAFTTSSQFKDAQNNQIPDVAQETSVKTFVKQFGVQGLDYPRGFDDEDYRGFPLQQ
jgi:hypothetical protein